MARTSESPTGTGTGTGASARFSAMADRVSSSAIRDLLALTEQPEVISLAGGKPAPETFPVDDIRAAADAVLARDGGAALQYSATEGYRPLREWVAATEAPGGVEEVTITAGSQQGLDLAARVLVDPGDVVVSADPGYIGAIQAFQLAGAEQMGMPSDRDGLRVDVLADRLAGGLRPRVVYVVADLSNPTGATLPEERRYELARLADRYGFWLLEDDPYRSLRWAGTAPPPLAGRCERVVRLGTMSKVLCPGLRVAYLVAPPEVSEAVVRVKQGADLHTATLSQRIVHELVSRPDFVTSRLATLPGLYRARAEALAGALRDHLGQAIGFVEPDGGMFLWARLPGVDTAALLAAALRAGVAFVPGAAFSITEPHPEHLRFSFATVSPVELDEGVRRLASVL